MENLFFFSGFYISQDKDPVKIEGIFDIQKKISDETFPSVINLSSILFKSGSFLSCKVSSQNENFKQVRNLDFLFHKEDQCYLAFVYSEKTYDWTYDDRTSKTENRIEKDTTARDVVGVLILQIISKDLHIFTIANEKLNFLIVKNKREVLV